jgi:adenylate cyclase
MQEGFAENPLNFRIGISLGDVVDDGEDIHGEGVNIAARIEALAEPGGIFVSGSVYEQMRHRVEAHFDDLGEHELKHISQPVKVYRLRGPRNSSIDALPQTLALPDKPSITVLPFENIAGDPEQAYFSDGLTEYLITGLSQLRWLFMIARNSAFSYKGTSPHAEQVAKELGVRCVLKESVRTAGGRIRVTAQLIDTEDGGHIWADTFDAQLEDVFDLQDEVTAKIVGALGPEMTQAETERVNENRTHGLEV